MAAYFTSQAYDVPSHLIWPILTDFASWPRWFPRVAAIDHDNGAKLDAGCEIIAIGDQPGVWTRWRIGEWREPSRLLCEHVDSSAGFGEHVQAAYLQFDLMDDAEGCTLEVEIGADGYGIVGDFFVGMTLGSEVRRLLPEIVDAFSDYVVLRAAPGI